MLLQNQLLYFKITLILYAKKENVMKICSVINIF